MFVPSAGLQIHGFLSIPCNASNIAKLAFYYRDLISVSNFFPGKCHRDIGKDAIIWKADIDEFHNVYAELGRWVNFCRVCFSRKWKQYLMTGAFPISFWSGDIYIMSFVNILSFSDWFNAMWSAVILTDRYNLWYIDLDSKLYNVWRRHALLISIADSSLISQR